VRYGTIKLMTHRRLLTPAFVNRIRAPRTGERWIADTKIRGFGLRLWRVRGNAGKAFGLRCADATGKPVRRTFKPNKHNHSRLGNLLEEARSWARDERDRLKGRLTVDQESLINKAGFERAFSKLTLRELADAKLYGMKALGRSDSYVTRCDKLFSQCVSALLQKKRLRSVKPEELARCLRRLDAKPGKARVLRAFLGQILNSAGDFDRRAWRLLDRTQRLYSPNYESRRLYEAPQVSARKLHALFKHLSEERASVLPALYLRLLFEFEVPYEALLRARWEQIDGSIWYPWSEKERRYSWLQRRRIEPWTRRVLERLERETSKFAPRSPFLFPSLNSRSGHMRTFQSYWVRVAHKLSMSKHSLKKWIRAYHRHILLPMHMRQISAQLMIAAELSNGTHEHDGTPPFVWLC
jgi:hypothetical protein